MWRNRDGPITAGSMEGIELGMIVVILSQECFKIHVAELLEECVVIFTGSQTHTWKGVSTYWLVLLQLLLQHQSDCTNNPCMVALFIITFNKKEAG